MQRPDPLPAGLPGLAQPVKVPVTVTHTQRPRLDLFAGYSHWAPHAAINNYHYKAVNEGFTLSAAYYVNPYMGAQFEASRTVQTSNDAMRSFSGGMIVRYPMLDGMIPFAHALV